MPAAVVVEMLLELFGQLVFELGATGVRAGVSSAKEAIEERRARERERALASVDLLVLAAYHDHVITEAERGVLAKACETRLAKLDIAVDVDELLARWAVDRAALESEEAYVARAREIARILKPRERAKVLEWVERLVAADAPTATGFRERAPSSGADTLAVFRGALSDPE